MGIISLLNSSSDNCSSALKLSADQSSLTVGQLQLRNNLLLDSSADQNCFADQNVLLLDSSAVQSCFAAETAADENYPPLGQLCRSEALDSPVYRTTCPAVGQLRTVTDQKCSFIGQLTSQIRTAPLLGNENSSDQNCFTIGKLALQLVLINNPPHTPLL
jgi:hypothetical protein